MTRSDLPDSFIVELTSMEQTDALLHSLYLLGLYFIGGNISASYLIRYKYTALIINPYLDADKREYNRIYTTDWPIKNVMKRSPNAVLLSLKEIIIDNIP